MIREGVPKDTFVEHPQVDRVRLICKGTMADAVWYDYHGGSEVADERRSLDRSRALRVRQWTLRRRAGSRDIVTAPCYHRSMKFPCVILEVALTSTERAAIMGGQEKPRDHDAVRVRIVQTGERQGFPILVCEAAGELDAMGQCQWHKADLPWQIIAALLLKASRGDVRSAESFA